MIVVIDYGLGNLGAIVNMLRKVEATAKISSEKKDIQNANKLILPGIGAYDEGMKNLRATELVPLLNQLVLEQKVPILGICLGMQLFTCRSEEGEAKEPGLGWIQAKTVRFDTSSNPGLKVPHMGWNFVDFKKKSPLACEMPIDARFYFVHSYHPVCDNPDDVMLVANYGYEFAAGIHHGNIYGVQFHPEKSHKFGMRLLKNFVERVK